MVCHLFLKKNPLAILERASEMRHDFAPIGFAGCDHFIRSWMFYTRRIEVIGIKRLIDDDCIVPIAPCAHHCRGDISRTRPHGDADGLCHPQRLSRYGNLASENQLSLALALIAPTAAP